MITLYLSDFILGIDNENHNLSLDNVVYECEKLFEKLKDIKKNYKHLVGEVKTTHNHKIHSYLLEEIMSKLKDRNRVLWSYMLNILTLPQYANSKQQDVIKYKNINYSSHIINLCYQNKGILIGIILNIQHINRLPYNDTYITLMHQENYEYIKKYVLLNDSFYLSRIYLDMLNSGYNLLFHIQAYNTLCEKIFLSYSSDIEYRISNILALNHFEDYDCDIIKKESDKIFVIRNRNPMYRIYFLKNGKNIYFLDLAYNHNKKNIDNKIQSAEKRYKEKENLKDIFDIDDDKYLKK